MSFAWCRKFQSICRPPRQSTYPAAKSHTAMLSLLSCRESTEPFGLMFLLHHVQFPCCSFSSFSLACTFTYRYSNAIFFYYGKSRFFYTPLFRFTRLSILTPKKSAMFRTIANDGIFRPVS